MRCRKYSFEWEVNYSHQGSLLLWSILLSMSFSCSLLSFCPYSPPHFCPSILQLCYPVNLATSWSSRELGGQCRLEGMSCSTAATLQQMLPGCSSSLLQPLALPVSSEAPNGEFWNNPVPNMFLHSCTQLASSLCSWEESFHLLYFPEVR